MRSKTAGGNSPWGVCFSGEGFLALFSGFPVQAGGGGLILDEFPSLTSRVAAHTEIHPCIPQACGGHWEPLPAPPLAPFLLPLHIWGVGAFCFLLNFFQLPLKHGVIKSTAFFWVVFLLNAADVRPHGQILYRAGLCRILLTTEGSRGIFPSPRAARALFSTRRKPQTTGFSFDS